MEINQSALFRQIEPEELQTPEEKRRQLFLRQKQLLDQFLKTGAISQAQYDKSLGDLTRKMGYGD